MNRITASNSEDAFKAKILNSATNNESLNSRIFYFGQVINNEDEKNLNRIKIRIPKIDDVYYTGVTKEEGDKLLPWAVPNSNRFIETPENNAIVLVAIFDVKTPYSGRIYFDSFSDVSNSELFERLGLDVTVLSNFELVEDIFSININSKPNPANQYNTKENKNFKTGIRGKGKNKLLFDESSTQLTQNEGDNQSFLKLTENTTLESSDNLELISKKGYAEKYHPVFDTLTFNYLSSVNQLLKKIVSVLNTTPAISPAGLCIPSKQGKTLVKELKSLSKEFDKFKAKGSSKKLTIN